jgi:branched-chain amino acid transport system ATP-binding protein
VITGAGHLDYRVGADNCQGDWGRRGPGYPIDVVLGDFILETSALQKRFGGVRAVDDVNFRLRRGELRCLIGPNGAGKSTFFKLLSGQLGPSAGTIRFEGIPIEGIAMHQIARLGIGIKNQVPSLFEGLAVRENLWIAARLRQPVGVADRAVDDLIERLGIGSFTEQTVASLAHGQRQWVEIGMVMAGRPKLVLLDEPTAGMAREEVARTAALIRNINRDASVIVVEHDMQFVRQLDALVTVFHGGRILVEDTMVNIQRDPRVREIYLGSARYA